MLQRLQPYGVEAATLPCRGCNPTWRDVTLWQFSHLRRLLLWHGRNCHIRSATLSQFVIHRGLIISVIQAHAHAVPSGTIHA